MRIPTILSLALALGLAASAGELRPDPAAKYAEARHYREAATRLPAIALEMKHPNSPGSRGRNLWLAARLESEAAQMALTDQPQAPACDSRGTCCAGTCCGSKACC